MAPNDIAAAHAPTDDQTTTPDLNALREDIEAHDDVTRVSEPDSYDGLMVICEWIDESHVENGTRIIDEANYDGEIPRVTSFLKDIDGVQIARSGTHGLEGYIWHLEVA